MNDKRNIKVVVFCSTCRTDLRLKNKTKHEAMGHRVEEFEEDPRDKRTAPEANPSARDRLKWGGNGKLP